MTGKEISAPQAEPARSGAGFGEIAVRVVEAGPGALVSFPFDAATVERFKAAFPRARWRQDETAWFVPGKTAQKRAARWLERELATLAAFEDERGRDAFSFEPIDSPYLSAADGLVVTTPYSQTVIDELRAVPFARWDRERRAWIIPFRFYEALRARWPRIEAAAAQAEPAERAERRNQPLSSKQARTREQARERRRRRYPISMSEVPPDRPVMTAIGPIVMTGSHGELVDRTQFVGLYPHLAAEEAYVWVSWRPPTLEELVRSWPARRPATSNERQRGWWQPTLEELRPARRKARSLERAVATRRSARG